MIDVTTIAVLTNGGGNMIRKLKNNNSAGGDLQFAIVTFLFVFVVCVCLLLDFWFVSTAKISVTKAVQSAELYCLVTKAPKIGGGAGDGDEAIQGDMWSANLQQFQTQALKCYKDEGELYARINNIPYLRDEQYNLIEGLANPVGQMGIRTEMKYRVKTFIRSPGQMFNFMRGNTDPDLDATKWVSLKVTTKLVPRITDRTSTNK